MTAPITTATTDVSPANYQTSQSTTQSPTPVGKAECPECDSYVSTVDVREAVCPNCHIIIDPLPVTRDPKPTYSDDDYSRKRTGGRVTHQHADGGIGTGADETLFRRLAADPHRTSEDSRIEGALGEIRRIRSILELSNQEAEAASRLYKMAHKKGIIEGRCIEGFAGACLLAAVRQSPTTIPVSETEIRNVSGATKEQFRNARGALELFLDVEIPPMPPEDFLGMSSRELGTPWRAIRCARKLLRARKEDESAVASISPRTLAAVAVAVACDVTDCVETPKLADLAETFGVGRSTISRQKSAIEPYLEQIDNN